MSRQTVINAIVGSIMGYIAAALFIQGHYGLGIVLLLAWFTGMINSLMPTDHY